MGAQDQIVATEAKIASAQGAQVTDKPAAVVADVVETPDALTDQTGDDAESSSDAGQPRHSNKKPAAERISELTKNWRQEEREKKAAREEAEYWRQQAMTRNPQQPTTQTQPTQDSQKQTLESFGYDQERYLEYLAEQKAEQVIRKRDEAKTQGEQQAAAKARVQSYQERIAQFEAANPGIDYHTDVTNGALPISEPMADYIVESDIGPQLGIYFRDNPDEAKAIYALSPRAADRALAKLEAKLTNTASSEPTIPRPPVQITRAPPVPGRVSAGQPSKVAAGVQAEIDAVRELRKRRT